MPSRRLAYKPDAATELAIEELSWLSDPSTLQRRAQKAKKQHRQEQHQGQRIQDEQDSSPSHQFGFSEPQQRHSNFDELLSEEDEENYNNSTLTRQHLEQPQPQNYNNSTLTRQHLEQPQPQSNFHTIEREDGVKVRHHKIQLQKEQEKKPFSRYSYEYQDGQQRSFYEEFSVGTDQDTKVHTQISHEAAAVDHRHSSYNPAPKQAVHPRPLSSQPHQYSSSTLEQRERQQQTERNTNYNTLPQQRTQSSPPNERRAIIPSERTRQLALAQSEQQLITHEQAHYQGEPVQNDNAAVRFRRQSQPPDTIDRSTTKSQKQRHSQKAPVVDKHKERKEKSKSTGSGAGGTMSFQKCSQCNGIIFSSPIKCSNCGAVAHQNDKCAHFLKKERKRDGFDWYCSSNCLLSMQQRKFAVWTMLAQEQFDALVIFNANIPKKSEVQHLKFTGYSLYFDEDRRHAIYAKSDLKPRRFELPENKDDVLKLNGGHFSTIIISFQQRGAATIGLLSRPKNAEDHGPFRERFTDWLTRLLWAMSCGWEHSRTMTPNISARRLVLACDLNINPPYTVIKANRKTQYYKYLKPIEQRFHLRQHMTRETSALGLGKLFFTGDQLRINRSGFDQMFDEKKRTAPVMVNGDAPPPKSPSKPPSTPQLYWCFLSTGHRLSHTPSLRSTVSTGGAHSLRSVPRSRSMPPDYAVGPADRHPNRNPLMIHSGTNTIDSRISRDTMTHTYGPIEMDNDDLLDGQATNEHSRFADIRELREQADRLSTYDNQDNQGRMTSSSTASNVMRGN